MQTSKFLYFFFLLLVVVFSYMFVDPNFPLPIPAWASFFNRGLTGTVLYGGMVGGFYIFYLYFLSMFRKKTDYGRQLKQLIIIQSIILLFSYPAFSYDIFNYIATAKVAFLYRENPYIVMPIELTNEPLLAFMHAANKTALYGPSWILLTAIPFLVGGKNIYLSIVAFKLFVMLGYLGLSYVLYSFSKKNSFTTALFALNPLVVIETLIGGHNDVVMMFFMLFSFFLLTKRLYIFSVVSSIVSFLVKFATLFLLPVFCMVFITIAKNRKVPWETVWFRCFLLMAIPFLLSPLREEIYSWYFIWPFTFLVLTKNKWLQNLGIVLSLGLLLRFAPYVFYRRWDGLVPVIKIIVTLTPPVLYTLFTVVRKIK